MDYVKQSDLLKALAHPVRLRMVEGLLGHECHVDRMVRGLGLPQSTVSQHLGVLKSKGIVQVRKEGVKTCYKVLHPAVAKIVAALGK